MIRLGAMLASLGGVRRLVHVVSQQSSCPLAASVLQMLPCLDEKHGALPMDHVPASMCQLANATAPVMAFEILAGLASTTAASHLLETPWMHVANPKCGRCTLHNTSTWTRPHRSIPCWAHLRTFPCHLLAPRYCCPTLLVPPTSAAGASGHCIGIDWHTPTLGPPWTQSESWCSVWEIVHAWNLVCSAGGIRQLIGICSMSPALVNAMLRLRLGGLAEAAADVLQGLQNGMLEYQAAYQAAYHAALQQQVRTTYLPAGHAPH